MKRILLNLIVTILITNAHAQEMWGLSNSNYAGSMGIALNPSSIVGAPYKYDFNILAFDIFAENNLAWLPASDKLLYHAVNGSSDAPTVVVDNFSDSKKSAFVHADIMGPSFIWSEDKNYSWGFHTEFRTEAGILKVPYGLNNDFGVVSNGAAGTLDFTVPHFSAAMMSWGEMGITYGRVTENSTQKYVKWGITLNYLRAFDGMYINLKNLTYSTTDSTSNVHNVDATIAHATSNSGQGSIQDLLDGRGTGLGTTIGVTIMKGRSQRAYSLKKAADDLQKYKYRLGFSLMDVGLVRFNGSGDSRVVDLNSTGATSTNNLNNLQFGSFQHFDTALVNRIGGTVSNKPFNIWLPTALSAQFDYSLTPHWYFNATALNRVHFTANQIARGNQDVLSLRYETRHFEFSGNINLFEYSSLSTGFCLRYRWFFIGTDRLSQWASIANLNSIDLYFGFKINFTSLPPKNKHSTSCPAYKAN